MLSVPQCRALLERTDLPDDEIERLRDQLYLLAEVLFDGFSIDEPTDGFSKCGNKTLTDNTDETAAHTN